MKMKNTQKIITKGLQLQQVGEKFTIHVILPEKNDTKYFSKMGKIATLLLAIDRYLTACLSHKIKVKHLMEIDTANDLLIIDESIKIEGPEGDQFKIYLRKGKEMILANLYRISDRTGFETLMAELTALVNDTYISLPKNLPLNCMSLKEIHLARLVDEIWRYNHGPGRKVKIYVTSLKNSPQATFQFEPPLREWYPIEYSDKTKGTFILVSSNFENPQKWKGRRVNDGDRSQIDIMITAPDFLEKLQSSEENAPNGLLIGDKLETYYRTVYDPLTGKTIYDVLRVLKLVRAPKKEHQEELRYS